MGRKHFFIFLILLLSLCLSCGSDKEDSVSYATPSAPENKRSLAVMAVSVEESPVVVRIEAAGLIEGIRESDILSETSGEIQTVNFEMGDYIQKGDVLLTVEDVLPRLAFDSARKEYRAAELEFEALEKSYQAGGSSLIDYQQGLAQMASMRLKTEEASVVYNNTKIRAPYSGFAGSREKGIDPGSILQVGEIVTHLVDNSFFQIRLTVGEDEFHLIRKGDKAQVFVGALGNAVIDARVRAVSPGSLVNGGGFPVWVSWENKGNKAVKAGMSARVSIITSDRGERSLFLPEEAIQMRNGQQVVFRVEENRAELVPLEYQRTVDGRIFQSAGALRPGDMVVVSGFGTLLPGDTVRVSERSGGSEP